MPKFKPQLVINLHADCFGEYHHGAKVESVFSVGFNYEGARYHIWFVNGIDQEILYKNPPLGMDVHDPAHYQPRKLALSAAFGLSVLAWLEPQYKALKAQAKAEFDAKESADATRRAALVAEDRLANAAPALLQALWDIRNNLVGHPEIHAIAKAAIEKAVDFS